MPREYRSFSERRMAQPTLDYLLQRREELEQKKKNPGRGEEVEATLALIGDLSDVNIIQPREETTVVGLGNRVTVEYEDGEQEDWHVLGPDDCTYGIVPGVISFKSPIGSALLGESKGAQVTCSLPENRETQLKILKIEPGNF